MAGGYWGKNQNPYWNADSNAALQDQRIRASRADAFDAQLKVSEARTDTEILREQLNQTIASNSNIVSNYEQKIEKMKGAFFKLAMKSNIFHRTLLKLQEKWPDKKEDILDEIQIARNEANTEEYRQKWWTWVENFDMDNQHEYLKFPFEAREVKKPKL